jgi:hypothetical protein
LVKPQDGRGCVLYCTAPTDGQAAKPANTFDPPANYLMHYRGHVD